MAKKRSILRAASIKLTRMRKRGVDEDTIEDFVESGGKSEKTIGPITEDRFNEFSGILFTIFDAFLKNAKKVDSLNDKLAKGAGVAMVATDSGADGVLEEEGGFLKKLFDGIKGILGMIKDAIGKILDVIKWAVGALFGLLTPNLVKRLRRASKISKISRAEMEKIRKTLRAEIHAEIKKKPNPLTATNKKPTDARTAAQAELAETVKKHNAKMATLNNQLGEAKAELKKAMKAGDNPNPLRKLYNQALKDITLWRNMNNWNVEILNDTLAKMDKMRSNRAAIAKEQKKIAKNLKATGITQKATGAAQKATGITQKATGIAQGKVQKLHDAAKSHTIKTPGDNMAAKGKARVEKNSGKAIKNWYPKASKAFSLANKTMDAAGKYLLRASTVKVPLIGTLIGTGFVVFDMYQQDYNGAKLAGMSTVSGFFPGAGTAISLMTDVAYITRLIYNDLYAADLKFADQPGSDITTGQLKETSGKAPMAPGDPGFDIFWHDKSYRIRLFASRMPACAEKAKEIVIKWFESNEVDWSKKAQMEWDKEVDAFNKLSDDERKEKLKVASAGSRGSARATAQAAGGAPSTATTEAMQKMFALRDKFAKGDENVTVSDQVWAALKKERAFKDQALAKSMIDGQATGKGLTRDQHSVQYDKKLNEQLVSGAVPQNMIRTKATNKRLEAKKAQLTGVNENQDELEDKLNEAQSGLARVSAPRPAERGRSQLTAGTREANKLGRIEVWQKKIAELEAAAAASAERAAALVVIINGLRTQTYEPASQ